VETVPPKDIEPCPKNREPLAMGPNAGNTRHSPSAWQEKLICESGSVVAPAIVKLVITSEVVINKTNRKSNIFALIIYYTPQSMLFYDYIALINLFQ